ncbi:MAG: hypothetical protein WCA24_12420 [Thiomonas sp.]
MNAALGWRVVLAAVAFFAAGFAVAILSALREVELLVRLFAVWLGANRQQCGLTVVMDAGLEPPDPHEN